MSVLDWKKVVDGAVGPSAPVALPKGDQGRTGARGATKESEEGMLFPLEGLMIRLVEQFQGT